MVAWGNRSTFDFIARAITAIIVANAIFRNKSMNEEKKTWRSRSAVRRRRVGGV